MNALGEIMRLMGKSYGDALGLVNRSGPTLFTALVILAAGDVAGILAMRLFTSELGKTLIGALASVAALWFAAPFIVQLMRQLLEDQIKPGLESFTGAAVSAGGTEATGPSMPAQVAGREKTECGSGRNRAGILPIDGSATRR